MKKYIYYSLILIFLFANNVCGQTMFIEELAEAKKLPPSAKKDSIIVENLYQIIQIPSENVSKWRDSLKLFSINNNNRIAYLLNNIRESDNIINGMNEKNGSNNLLQIAKELESKKYYAYSSYSYLKIGAIYHYILPDRNEKNKAFLYYKKALELALLSNSELDITRVYDYIGECYLALKDYPKAIKYLKIAEKRQLNYNIKYILPTIYASLAACYLGLNNIEIAEKYNTKINPILNDKKYNISVGYQAYIKHIYLSKVAEYYYLKKMHHNSLSRCIEGLKMIDIFMKTYGYRNDFETYKLSYLEIIHKNYFKLNNIKKAYYYLNMYETKQKQHLKNMQIKEFNELNLKYQTDQNKLRITALQNENLKKDVDKQATFRYFGAALILLLLLVIGITFYSNASLRKKNAEISKAMLQGQTIERKRVAADLHDSLGSTMSSLIYTVNAIDTNNLDNDEKNVYQHLKQMLDTAYNEIRLLSHNLLPEEFEKQGLAEALRHFVRKINQTKTIQFDLAIDPQLGRLSPKIEFELYSICLELINNILKHSKATQAQINLSKITPPLGAGGLLLVIADNGRGFFDNDSDGKGMKNVKARVESLKGTWHTTNTEGQGVCNEIVVPV